ncbi:MAG TPA: phosphonate metabolism transcriptional regulator PhnF [Beijerinckiaceae bacterium]|jgi:GntR family phosphonate transport system transcriptional regulator
MSADPVPHSPPLLPRDGVAAWRQIVDALESDIAAGRLAPGAQMPTEARLAERFGVNRHTVRRALGVLASRGLVRATQGRGTFVEPKPLAYPIGPRTRFSEVVSRAGREAWGDLVASAEIPADPSVAAALNVEAGRPVLELVTVHKADGTPISMARTCLVLPRFSGLDRTYRDTGSLTRAYAAHGLSDYLRLSTRVTGRQAGLEEARLLDLVPGRVLLVIDSVNADPEGRPIQATRSHFAADRVELVIEA